MPVAVGWIKVTCEDCGYRKMFWASDVLIELSHCPECHGDRVKMKILGRPRINRIGAFLMSLLEK